MIEAEMLRFAENANDNAGAKDLSKTGIWLQNGCVTEQAVRFETMNRKDEFR